MDELLAIERGSAIAQFGHLANRTDSGRSE